MHVPESRLESSQESDTHDRSRRGLARSGLFLRPSLAVSATLWAVACGASETEEDTVVEDTTDAVDTSDTAPGDTDAGDTDAGDTDPGDTDAGDTAPGDTAPGDTAPGDTAPGDTAPGDTAPGDTAPGDTDPGDTEPGDTAPGDTAPGDTAPGDTDPGDTGETEPGDTGETDPGDPPPGFVRIPAGSFMMGSPADEVGRDSDETQHEVTLTRDFHLQRTEVTQAAWLEVMEGNPSYFLECGLDCPVELVLWAAAIAYANETSRAEGLEPCYDAEGAVIGGETVYDCEGYRLPTEAEWEYAARAGTTSATSAGELEDIFCDDTALIAFAWYCGSLLDLTSPAGTTLPNAWGLSDMLGNVWEWTSDWYAEYDGAATDPVGGPPGLRRVYRGGGWNDFAEQVRFANRPDEDLPFGRFSVGLRLARTAP